MHKTNISKLLAKPIHLSARTQKISFNEGTRNEDIQLTAEFPFGFVSFVFSLSLNENGKEEILIDTERVIREIASQLPNVKRRSKLADEAIVFWARERADEYLKSRVLQI